MCVADLDPDGGRFHEDNTGVFHYGFSRDEMTGWFRDAGLSDIKSMTAAAVERKDGTGEAVSFTVFLVSGKRL